MSRASHALVCCVYVLLSIFAFGDILAVIRWLVSGVRHDAYAQAHPLVVEALKSPEEAGLFLNAEEHNEPAERSLDMLFAPPVNDSHRR
jgi:hypothetical protein